MSEGQPASHLVEKRHHCFSGIYRDLPDLPGFTRFTEIYRIYHYVEAVSSAKKRLLLKTKDKPHVNSNSARLVFATFFGSLHKRPLPRYSHSE